MTNCHKRCSLATNKAFEITDLCLRIVHGYTFTDTSEGGAEPCLAFFQSMERQKKGSRHWKIGVQPGVAKGTQTVCDPYFLLHDKGAHPW
jgi:hypothetical protein